MENIKIEETFYENKIPKTLRHIKNNEANPLLEKGWYENGQLQYELIYKTPIRFVKRWNEEGNLYFESESKEIEVQGVSRLQNIKAIYYYPNGQIAKHSEGYGKTQYFDKEGKSITKSEYELSPFYIALPY